MYLLGAYINLWEKLEKRTILVPFLPKIIIIVEGIKRGHVNGIKNRWNPQNGRRVAQFFVIANWCSFEGMTKMFHMAIFPISHISGRL